MFIGIYVVRIRVMSGLLMKTRSVFSKNGCRDVSALQIQASVSFGTFLISWRSIASVKLLPRTFARMPPKFTPRAPQVGRYWPGKPLKEDEESSSEEEDEDEEQEEEKGDQQVVQPPPPTADTRSVTAGKLITTMKTTRLSEQGPYMEPEEESSESESEEEEPDQQDKRRSKIRQANRRATGDFVAVDRVDLEEEEEVVPLVFEKFLTLVV